ncbi:MAG: hypothetical protein J1F29_07140, partial [Lentimicrobiaceae bacterium]|nr:hypothetical protein [Lentimicrobiaceae bacterium]
MFRASFGSQFRICAKLQIIHAITKFKVGEEAGAGGDEISAKKAFCSYKKFVNFATLSNKDVTFLQPFARIQPQRGNGRRPWTAA